MGIPTYILSSEKRVYHKEHILDQFSLRDEFDVTIIEIRDDSYKVVMWENIKQIIQKAELEHQKYIIICGDDHQFTSAYSKEFLFASINEALKKRVDILSGGTRWYNSIQISDSLFWADRFLDTQFIIIFSSIFNVFVETNWDTTKYVDFVINNLFANKFFIYPFISIRKGIINHDINANELIDKKEMLFAKSAENVKTLKDIVAFYKNCNVVKHKEGELENTVITTYIINLPERTDRRKHIKEEFAGKTEFDIVFIEAYKHEIGAVGLWHSIRNAVELAIINEDDVIIICEDDHIFTEHYNKEYLLQSIIEANEYGVELLSGGIGNFDMVIPIDENMAWINNLICTQFIILFRPIFQNIMDAPFDDKVQADFILSNLSANKMVLFPFISIQKNFGYSDVTKEIKQDKELIDRMFISTNELLQNIFNAAKQFGII